MSSIASGYDYIDGVRLPFSGSTGNPYPPISVDLSSGLASGFINLLSIIGGRQLEVYYDGRMPLSGSIGGSVFDETPPTGPIVASGTASSYPLRDDVIYDRRT